jgi:hypothetical protein
MKRIVAALGAGYLLAYFTLALGGAIILNFQASAGFNQVTLKWTTENEQNLKGFEVERSFDSSSESNYKKLAFVAASSEQKNRKEYTYQDNTVFKALERSYYYRLKIVDNDGTASIYSKVLTVTPTVSSARQTWGSIKAMFR